jgi:GxxExxY protein
MSDVNGIYHGEHGGHGEVQVRDCPDALIDLVLDAATEVHRSLGPGLLESVYEKALAIELTEQGIAFACQRPVPAFYRGHDLGIGFRADMIVEESLLLEIKAVDDWSSAHMSQVITYLRLLNLKRGYLLNFNKRLLKDGIKRVSI